MKIARIVFPALAALAFAAAPARADDEADILAAAQDAFAPYTAKGDGREPEWERPIYSSEARALIEEWKAGLSDEEPEFLNDFSWLCQCQDFDAEKFLVEFEVFHADDTDTSTVVALVNLGWEGADRDESELYFVRENGRWLLDDIVSLSFPGGLKADLKASIAEHNGVPREDDHDHDHH